MNARTDSQLVTMSSPADRKVALFRALFRGREDVYARRFESAKSGKKGYSPVCEVEWTRGLCDKRRVACALCPNRRFRPLSDAAVEAHLRGHDAAGRPFVLGVYPLLADDTVRFAAIDFDKASWRSDSASVCATLRTLGWPVARERSRSGNGAHLWFFFDEPIPARFVREALTYALTRTMETNPEVGLDSYDRIFPNQDRLPKGGFGNLIALPLQGEPRRRGDSCFVDDRLVPFADQWRFLSELPLVTRALVDALCARAASERRRVLPQAEAEILRHEPWSLFNPSDVSKSAPAPSAAYEFPSEAVADKIQITLGNAVYLRQTELTPTLRGRLIRLASFVNPKYAEMQRLRLSVSATPRVIDCSLNGDDHLVLPRGCFEKAVATIQAEGAPFEVVDRRQGGQSLAVSFAGELREEQRLAANALRAHETGVLAAGTAFGKTVLAAWLIAERKVSTLVLVNRRELQRQWIERLSQFLGIPKREIGRVGGGADRANGRLDVALVQSLTRLDGAFLANAVKGYGQVVVDECHAISAPSFEKVARAASARYFLGLSATLVRKDGHHPIVEMQCGPVRHRVDATRMGGYAAFRHVVSVRPTPFVPPTGSVADEGKAAFAELMGQLVACEARNAQIVRDVLANVREGRSPIVISERKSHLVEIRRALEGKVDHLLLLTGGMGRKAAKAARAEIEAVPASESRVLLATGSYLGEGFDDARLDTLMLALPISWRGRLTQYAGRLHRLRDGKREVRVYDYVDMRVATCATMFNRRCAGYRAMGYEIELANDTAEGWPAGVALPVELRDDKTYAETIKRLARDGADGETADLFVAAALAQRGQAPEVGGRSAAEKFLFRYLEAMPATKGLFALNGRLPVPFGPNDFMEVDLLCASRRLAVEIDGKFHFASPENYRRDRRKDFLLQKADYLVLRFLAEDVVERLPEVLDAIHAALDSRAPRPDAQHFPAEKAGGIHDER